jgi:hypothetical protein
MLTLSDLELIHQVVCEELAPLVESLAVVEQVAQHVESLQQKIITGLCERVAGQAAVIARRAERPDSVEQRVLHRIAAAAGMPEPGDGCREVIRLVKQALGESS